MSKLRNEGRSIFVAISLALSIASLCRSQELPVPLSPDLRAHLGTPVDEAAQASEETKLGRTPELETTEKSPSFEQQDPQIMTARLRGRIHADAIFVTQSPRDKAIIGDILNATGFTSARLGAEGTVGDLGTGSQSSISPAGLFRFGTCISG